MATKDLRGVYVASLTPLKSDLSPDLGAIIPLLEFYAQRGAHGALLLGTTGEGPSFAPNERISIWREATKIRQSHPDFRLLAGTGTPSLEETASLTHAAFDLGFDGVVVLPPFYFRSANDDGLFAWFEALIPRSVPSDGAFLGYHIPQVAGVGYSLDLLARLRDAFPNQFVGIKDSSGDARHATLLGERFGDDLLVLTGNDRLLSHAMQHHAGGCITALANLVSPTLRAAWEKLIAGGDASAEQEKLNRWRAVFDQYAPFGPALKAILPRLHDFPRWPVRPPLQPLSAEKTAEAIQRLNAIAPLP